MRKLIMFVLAWLGMIVLVLSTQSISTQFEFNSYCLSKNGTVVSTTDNYRFCLRPE